LATESALEYLVLSLPKKWWIHFNKCHLRSAYYRAFTAIIRILRNSSGESKVGHLVTKK